MREDGIAVAASSLQAKKRADKLQLCKKLVQMIDEQGVGCLQHADGRELWMQVKRELGVRD